MKIPFVLTLDVDDKTVRNQIRQIIEGIFNNLNINIKLADSKKEQMVKDIIDESLNRETEQVIWDKFWEMLSTQCNEPHFEIIITDKGLRAEGTNFIYGRTVEFINQLGQIIVWKGDKKYRYGIIISIKEIKERCPENWKDCFSLLTFHELGHFFGIPPVDSKKYTLG